MDQRQAQIRERAGLEEARYNQDFIEWLRKWGVPILFVFALAAGAYGLHDRYRRSQDNKLDDAFGELETVASSANPSPDTLVEIATSYEGKASVSILARLGAADAYLDAVRKGIRPGAQVNPDGNLEKPDDALKPEDKASFLTTAGGLYQQAYDAARSDKGKDILAINALYGIAAVAEGKQAFQEAMAAYQTIAKMAEADGFTAQMGVAKTRIARLDELKSVPKVYFKAELPPIPEAAKPTLTPMTGPPDFMYDQPGSGVLAAPALPPGMKSMPGAQAPPPLATPAAEPGTTPPPAAAPTPAPTTAPPGTPAPTPQPATNAPPSNPTPTPPAPPK